MVRVKGFRGFGFRDLRLWGLGLEGLRGLRIEGFGTY